MAQKKMKWLDIASMSLSGLCVIHCLALPFVIVALPFLGIFANNDWVHPILVIIAAPLSLWAIISSSAWRKWKISLLVAAGITLLALAAFVPGLSANEVTLSVIGALCIAAAHALNYLHHKARHEHNASCGHADGFAGD
jgi:predicted neutral ceramidase superfamily lipid hydrolase